MRILKFFHYKRASNQICLSFLLENTVFYQLLKSYLIAVFHLMHKELPKPDVYVYLYQNTERLLANIKKRGRVFEQGINSSYLQKINEGYLEFIKNQHDDSIKIIDISNKDFIENREDYLELLKEILN